MTHLEVYQFKGDESPMNNDTNPLNVVLNSSSFFKYKANLLGKATDADGNDRSLKKYKNSCSTKIFI